MNVAELKRELQRLGVSTATPGLFGDERLEELRARWELAVKQSSSSSHLSKKEEDTSTNSGSRPREPDLSETRDRAREVSAALPSVETLSIGELRSRLADLGISTATPGLAGEQRHQALLRRLVEAICGQEHPQQELNSAALAGEKPPVARSRRPPNDPPPEPTPVLETVQDFTPYDPADMQHSEDQQDLSVAQSELNELKKQIKRISNKRSIYIASQFSGPQQDSALKSMSNALQDIEADIAVCKGTSQRGERKIRSEMLRSRSSSEMKASIFIDDALAQLEARRHDLKEQVRVRRAEIKQEAEDNPEFGMEIEERLRQQMSQAAMTNSKVSRARKRFADMKTLDEAIVSAADGSHEVDLQTSEFDALKRFGDCKNDQIPKKEESLSVVDAFPSSSSSTSRMKADPLSGSSSARNSANSAEDSKDQHIDRAIVKALVPSGAVIEENPQRVKERMGLQRVPAPKGPPPKQIQLKNNEGKDNSEDSDSSGDDDGDEGSSEEEDGTSETESESDHGKARALSPSRSSSSENIDKDEVDSSLLTSGKSKPSIETQDSAVFESISINNDAQICPELTGPPVSNANDDSVDERMDHAIQLKTLREHARTLEKLDDFMAAEVLHERALELDPMDIQTLQGFAVFLHTKKGELARAEAFFNRALQLCLPSLFSQLHDPNRKMMTVEDTISNSSKEHHFSPSLDRQPPNPKELAAKEERFSLKSVVNLLLAFGSFLEKSKGDPEAAALLLQKAVRLAPENAFALASLAHFFTLHRGVCKNLTAKDTESMFRKALKLEPKNASYMMWYGKFLKKTKKLGPAELMYRSAVEVSKEDPSVEPSALCNYATFLFKYRKNTEKPQEIFTEALQRFPEHKGLRKNYAHLMKSIAKRDEKKEGDTEVRKIVSTPVVLRTATAHSASRGSKRAHRLTHSIVTEMPDMESTASKAEFILSHLGLQDETNTSALSPVVKKLEFAEEEGDFTEINPAMMQAKTSSFRDSLSPTKSFRGVHPSLKYFDEDEEEGASDKY